MRLKGRTTTVALVTSALLLVGCGDQGQETDPGPTAEPTSSPTPSVVAVDLPDTDAGRQTAWVLEQLEADPGTPVPEAEERFTQEFRDQLSAEQLVSVFDQLRALRPWTVTGVESGPTSLVAQISGGEELELQLAVDDDGVIAGLFFAEAAPPRDPAADPQSLLEEVETLPGSSLLVAEVVDGRCAPVEELSGGASAGEQLPIGSMVKLYVLGAVVDAVGAGSLAWEDEVTVTDELRSLPSGELQDAPAGTSLTVHEAARMMISISDNTATDLLMDAVGRAAVEQALTDLGHGDPAASTPVASTRELFHLGWGADTDLRAQWAQADEAGRRAILHALPAGPPEIDPSTMAQEAAWPDGVDWFATGADVCAAHAGLAERARTEHGEPVREILAANPGLPVDTEQWEHVAYKGGSSVGTMAGSWYAEPAGDGPPVVVVLQTAARSAEEAVDARTMVGIAQDALRLVAP